MKKQRIEAFSDGVIAIIITIMVLELRAPHGGQWGDLLPLLPAFGSYVLSFIYIAIYWNNHHHLFQAVERVNGRTLWANVHWLFWLSLMPVATAWMGENGFAPAPVTGYGLILLATGLAYSFLTHTLVAHHGSTSRLAKSLGRDRKGKISILLYVVGTAVATMVPWAACLLFALVAVAWFIPDRRIEKALHGHD